MFDNVKTFSDLVAAIIGLINAIIPVLGAIGLLAFTITGFLFVVDTSGGHIKAERKTAMFWSLIALFVLFSIWGILHILLNAFFG